MKVEERSVRVERKLNGGGTREDNEGGRNTRRARDVAQTLECLLSLQSPGSETPALPSTSLPSASSYTRSCSNVEGPELETLKTF